MTATPRIAGLEVAAHERDHYALAAYFAEVHPRLRFQLVEPDGSEQSLPCCVGLDMQGRPPADDACEALMKQVDELLGTILVRTAQAEKAAKELLRGVKAKAKKLH